LLFGAKFDDLSLFRDMTVAQHLKPETGFDQLLVFLFLLVNLFAAFSSHFVNNIQQFATVLLKGLLCILFWQLHNSWLIIVFFDADRISDGRNLHKRVSFVVLKNHD
jgi:hypothetical protein